MENKIKSYELTLDDLNPETAKKLIRDGFCSENNYTMPIAILDIEIEEEEEEKKKFVFISTYECEATCMEEAKEILANDFDSNSSIFGEWFEVEKGYRIDKYGAIIEKEE